MTFNQQHKRHTSTLLWAIDQLGGQSATARVCGVTHRAVRKWTEIGRMPLREWHNPTLARRICSELKRRGFSVSVDMLLGHVDSGFEAPLPRESTRSLAFEFLKNNPDATVAQIASAINRPKNTVATTIYRAAIAGSVVLTKDGPRSLYRLTEAVAR